MGFGTLFIGYFLLLNITYYAFTDLIAGLIMLLGLYKLSTVSRYFKIPMYISACFSVFGAGELVMGIIDMFFNTHVMDTVTTFIAIFRAILICALTVILLRAMHDIAKELEVEKVPMKCRTMTVWTVLLYVVQILLESTLLTSILPPQVSTILYIVVVIGMLIVVGANLTIIYSCYMRICLTEDLAPKEEKPSRFGFVNEYRRRRDERRAAEQEEYRRKLEERKRRRKK